MRASGTPAALITGAGRGLGRATALELAERGWRLALLSRTPADLEAVAALARQRGAHTVVVPAAVEDAAAVARAFEAVDAALGSLEALVHCAGVGSFAPVTETDPAEWARVLRVNLDGTFHCFREAARRMAPAGKGQIISVLSVAAKTVFPGAGAYCAGKWGALALTRVLAEEVRRSGVRVTALCPGSIDTPFWEGITHSLDPADMLRPEDVAVVIRGLLEQPAGVYTDEMVVMPPKGIL